MKKSERIDKLQSELSLFKRQHGIMYSAICKVGLLLGLIMPERVCHFEEEGFSAVERLQSKICDLKEENKNQKSELDLLRKYFEGS